MIKRKITAIALVAAVWTLAVAVFGVASLPSGVSRFVRYVSVHDPVFLWLIVRLWVVIPATFALCVIMTLEPVRDIFNRLVRRGRPNPPDRQHWSERFLLVFGLFLAGYQTLQTLVLELYWRVPAYAQVIKSGPHFFGFPNPHHWVPRFLTAAAGLLFAWMGNGLPKLQTPFKGAPEPYDWTRMTRDCGWVLTLGGLAAAACAVLLPYPLGNLAGASVIFASLIISALIWAAYRTIGRPTHLTPPGQMS